MTKKCIGCGVVLQNKDKDSLGYTPNLDKTYCMRCFRLKNYGKLERCDKVSDEDILKKVNHSYNFITFFLIDFLNITKDNLKIFKSISIPKVLVISKGDLLRREMKYEKIKLWLKEVYNITEDILFISDKNNYNSANILKYMELHGFNKAYIMGLTNAGKSTYLNKILKDNNINKEVLTSNKKNTTLDFIRFKINNYEIYDTPGFLYSNCDNITNIKELKQITYDLKNSTLVVINKTLKLYFKDSNQVTFYLNTDNIKREYRNTLDDTYEVKTLDNSDITIPGVGFVNVKKNTSVLINYKNYEVRKNISEVSYE